MQEQIDRNRLLTVLKSWWISYNRERFWAGAPNGTLDQQQRWAEYIASRYDTLTAAEQGSNGCRHHQVSMRDDAMTR